MGSLPQVTLDLSFGNREAHVHLARDQAANLTSEPVLDRLYAV